MPEGGFYEKRSISPTSLTIVICLHGAAITALALSKMEMPVVKVFTPLQIENVRIPPDPEPVPETEPKPDVRPKSQIDAVPRIVPLPPSRSDAVVIRDMPVLPTFYPDTSGSGTAIPVDLPKPDPVRIEAQMLRSSALQPPYPASEERAGVEGSVSIRVTIGTDGRVIRVAKISATNDAFYRATEHHALKAWRFKPAMLDGKPVEGSKVIHLRFQLDR